MNFYSFLLGLFYFLFVCRHLLSRAPVDNSYLRSTQSESSSRCINCCVAATNNRYLLSQVYFFVRSYILQKSYPGEGAGQILPCNPHFLVDPGANAKEDSFITLGFQTFDGEISPKRYIAADLTTKTGDGRYLLVQDYFGKATFWNSISEHPTKLRVCLENGYFVSLQGEVIGC